MGKTICDFFHFYAFEFEYASRVVSLSVPGVRTKKAKGWADELCLEDPYAPEHNMAKASPPWHPTPLSPYPPVPRPLASDVHSLIHVPPKLKPLPPCNL